PLPQVAPVRAGAQELRHPRRAAQDRLGQGQPWRAQAGRRAQPAAIAPAGVAMTHDLRAFLDAVRKARPADVVEVEREVDPRHETAAIVTKLETHGRTPVLMFRKVRGTTFPVVSNVCGSMGRLALALGCSLKDVGTVYGARAIQRVSPGFHDGPPPCQEVTAFVHDVDLHRPPALVYHLDEAAEPYITAAIVVARDPQTHKTNLSYHRMMISGPQQTGILMERGRHLHGIFEKYQRS